MNDMPDFALVEVVSPFAGRVLGRVVIWWISR